MLQLTINGMPVAAQSGQTVLEAATDAGITIPTLCHHKDLTPVASCRLCLVEVGSQPEPVTACSLAVTDGMQIRTETESLVSLRRTLLKMLSRDYARTDGNVMGKTNEFERWLDHYGVPHKGLQESPGEPADRESATLLRHAVDCDPNPFMRVDWNQCILCTRCVRACQEVQGRFVWGVANRAQQTQIIAGLDSTMVEAGCESCGACAAYCPTGALVDRAAQEQLEPDRTVMTTCSYCGVGCQFELHAKQDRIVGVTSTPDAAVNGMSLCVKGRYGWDYVHHKDRLTRPQVRETLLRAWQDRKRGFESSAVERSLGYRDRASRAAERGRWVEVDWDTALDIVAGSLQAIKAESGSNAIGVLSSAKCTNEENYLMQKFARQVLGTHNVDHCARLCHASTVVGLAAAFGSGAMSNSMQDIVEHARSMFIIGSNTTEQHPVFGAMIRQAVLRRNVELVVADPREIGITDFAVLHLRQRPGTDVALLNGIMRIVLHNGWHDQAFVDRRCEGFEEFRQRVEVYRPEMVARITGVPEHQLQAAAEILATRKPMATIWAMGITQHTTGVDNVLSLANLQMLLGNMGVPGGGVNPLRGQNNVQGACDMGALPNVFPGYQPVTDEAARSKFAEAWQTSEQNAALPKDEPAGLTVTEMVDRTADGQVRALYILGEDPVMTEPDNHHVEECLRQAEFVVLQEIFPSETSRFADVLLPGSSFAEKDGTFTNTERRIQLVRRAIPSLGKARSDWDIVSDLARRILVGERRRAVGRYAGWDFEHPAQIMEEVAALTPLYAGVRHGRLEAGEVLQWPVPETDHPGTPILHVMGFVRGKGKFHAVDHVAPTELPDDEYPLLLTTGRVLYHWHGGELTRRSAGLLQAYPETLVEVSSDDAAKLGIRDRGRVRLVSRRGEMVARAMVTARVPDGLVFGNFHFPERHNVNNLTIAALDPVAKIPEYKVCAVKLECFHDV